jgi:hypothetical protein
MKGIVRHKIKKVIRLVGAGSAEEAIMLHLTRSGDRTKR